MAKFILKPTRSGIKFDLLGADGAVLVTSEVYTSEKACLGGVESVRKSCLGGIEDQTVEGFAELKNPKFEVYTDKAGEFRFRLKAKNGQIIATGEGYKAKKSCMNGIESIRKNADSPIVYEE